MLIFKGWKMLKISLNDADRNYIYSKAILLLKEILDKELGILDENRLYLISVPPENIDADISYPLMREKNVREIDKQRIANIIKEKMQEELQIHTTVEMIYGYLNIKFDKEDYTRAFYTEFNSVVKPYGSSQLKEKIKVVVEHTSANPVHPLHIGHARNSSLGDTLSNLLNFYGFDVERRFYIDDVGRQTAVLVYAIKQLSKEENWIKMMGNTKPDHWLGQVYAIANTLIELNKVKKEMKMLTDEDKYKELAKKQDEVVAEAIRLREQNQVVFDVLAKYIIDAEDPESEISELSRLYEEGETSTVNLFREIIGYALEGFKQTLGKIGITFDKWDWESDLIWNGNVKLILEKARSTAFYTRYKDAEAIELQVILNEHLKRELRIPADMEIPPLILKRSDGTTLYTTRDIAYTIKKFEESGAEYVINVIGKEQMLPQAQLRAALYLLGYTKYAKNLIHYSYEMVTLPGFKMSGRRGRYITLDELLNLSIQKAKIELLKRGHKQDDSMLEEVSNAVGAAAIRYALVSVSSDKPIVLKIEDIVNFEKNSAPYVQYTYARACGLLRKAQGFDAPKNFDYLNNDALSYKLVRILSRFPWIIAKSTIELKPEIIVGYANELAQSFNKWYDTIPVLGDEVIDRRNLKLFLALSTKEILGSVLKILGIKPLERI